MPVTAVEKLCINEIAFCGCVSYCCLRSGSILSASRPLSLLVTRGFRERAFFAPNSSHVFLFLCCVSVFPDGEASGTAEDDGSRGPCLGSRYWAYRMLGLIGRRCDLSDAHANADGDCFGVAVTYSYADSHSDAHPDTEPYAIAYAIAEPDDAGLDARTLGGAGCSGTRADAGCGCSEWRR